MTCPEHLRTQSLLDGELNEREMADAQNHIDSCDECGHARTEMDALGHYIRHDATRYRAPQSLLANLHDALDAENVPRRSGNHVNRRSFWFGAAGGAGISALAAGLAFLMLLPPVANPLIEAVTDAHIRALMNGHVIAVASSNHHTVKPWFAGRVAISPPVADFAGNGFALAGGRVDTIAGSRAAVVVYRHGAHEVDLFVWPHMGARLPASGLRHGYHSEFWTQSDLDFAVVSDMQSSELEKFVLLVKRERE